MVISKKTITFQGFRGGPTFSRGGGGGGSKCPNANFYRNPYNLCFSRERGVRTPYPPSRSAHVFGCSFKKTKKNICVHL